ncbi:hypothetical protein C0585_01520 [Candidatus Woesearchaeota archaeon]|mgnify:CR=1 FL=1|nr:MAG: hypothetical protein C0585_01520 [Candidatus Woesearchaeota archaeon]
MNKKLALIILLSFISPSVLGASLLDSQCTGGGSLYGHDLGILSGPMELFMKIISSEISVFFMMFIFFFMLIYGTSYASLSKAKVFEGQKRSQKAVSVAIAAITNIAFFGLTTNHGGPKAALLRIITFSELLFGILIATVFFFVVYYSFKNDDSKGNTNWGLALLGAGIGLYLVGSLICQPEWYAWGSVLILFGLIGLLFSSVGKEGGILSKIGKAKTSNPKRPPTPPTPPRPPVPPVPPTPPDFTNELNEIERLLNEYETFLSDFKNKGNEILILHNQFLNSLSGYGPVVPPVSIEKLNAFFEVLSKLDLKGIDINQKFNDFLNLPNISKISEQQNNQFVNLSDQWVNHLNEFDNYKTEFKEKYDRGDI